jgi:hypothetical protein
MNDRVLLVLGFGNEAEAEASAFDYAAANELGLDVLDVLDSHLYHYGKNDIIVPGYARTQFLFHIQDNLRRQSQRREAELLKKSDDHDIHLRYGSLETDDPIPSIVKIAAKGYQRIFIPEEKRKLFPLNQRKTHSDRLRPLTSIPLEVC